MSPDLQGRNEVAMDPETKADVDGKRPFYLEGSTVRITTAVVIIVFVVGLVVTMLQSVETMVEGAKRENTESNKTVAEEIQKTGTRFTQDISNMRNDINLLTAEIRHSNESISSLGTSISTLLGMINTQGNRIQALEKDVEYLGKYLERIEKERKGG